MRTKQRRISNKLKTILPLILALYFPHIGAEDKTEPDADGIAIPRPAPAWDIDEWLNSPPPVEVCMASDLCG